MLNQRQIESFCEQGFLVLRQFCPAATRQHILELSKKHLDDRVVPYELESELQYPGAPNAASNGGQTIRRLKQAYDRAPTFANWATNNELSSILEQLLKEPVYLVRSHHNCVMTKQPRFSSDSLWHQDIRYWRYSQRELISAWLALGDETIKNGCLQVVPGSHRLSFSAEQFDDDSFFIKQLDENQRLLQQKQYIELDAGDLVLFHCRLLHSATRNYTDQTKFTAVFTYRAESDCPLADSRSASLTDVPLSLEGTSLEGNSFEDTSFEDTSFEGISEESNNNSADSMA